MRVNLGPDLAKVENPYFKTLSENDIMEVQKEYGIYTFMELLVVSDILVNRGQEIFAQTKILPVGLFFEGKKTTTCFNKNVFTNN